MNILMLLSVFALESIIVSDAVNTSTTPYVAKEKKMERGMYRACGEGLKIKSKNRCRACGCMNRKDAYFMIVNGETVKPAHKYPWMVSLQTLSGTNVCGGSIISQYYILTAAHCLNEEDYPKRYSKVNKEKMAWLTFSGATDIGVDLCPVYVKPENIMIAFSGPTLKGKRPRGNVAKVIPHEKHDHKIHDIALLRMKRRINCDQFASPICLPEKKRFCAKSQFTFSGWGTESATAGGSPDASQESNLVALSFDECLSLRPDYKRLEDMSICVKGEDKSSPCYGDSGSSMFGIIRNKAYVTGVASRLTKGGCRVGGLTVFTSLAAHMDWIKQKIK